MTHGTEKDTFKPAATLRRRQLLQGASAAGLGAALGAGGAIWPGTAQAQAMPHFDLTVRMATVDTDEPLRTYDGLTPGPTMRVDPGGKLSVRLVNELAPEDDDQACPANHNSFHGANITNLHTHGLHVAPGKSPGTDLDSDNIFLKITPKDQPISCPDPDFRRIGTEFLFDLPGTHPSGTFWYHAHKHGSTARQVANGMAGPLIVNDTETSMPAYIRAATAAGKDDIFMIQVREIASDGPVPGGQLTLVRAFEDGDGEKNPTVRMQRGEVRRLRFINAAPVADAFVDLRVQGGGANPPEIFQIAFDGLTLNQRLPVRALPSTNPWENPMALAPGNRTDVLIRVPMDATEGRFSLVARQAEPAVLHGVVARQATPIALNIEIAGQQAQADPWDADPGLPGPGLKPIGPEGAVKRAVEFGTNANGLAIDGEQFTGISKEPKMKLDSVGDWTVSNTTSSTHPFHIHVNPFYVTHINGVALAGLPDADPRRALMRWQDTIALPPKDGADGSVRFLTRFETFTGKFVIHCHILPHEDTGMMQAVEVIA